MIPLPVIGFIFTIIQEKVIMKIGEKLSKKKKQEDKKENKDDDNI